MRGESKHGFSGRIESKHLILVLLLLLIIIIIIINYYYYYYYIQDFAATKLSLNRIGVYCKLECSS